MTNVHVSVDAGCYCVCTVVCVVQFGITMWEIFYGMEPYPGMSALQVAHRVVSKGKRPRPPSKDCKHTEMPDAYEILMERCWAQDHGRRPRFDHILKELERIEDFGFQRVP